MSYITGEIEKILDMNNPEIHQLWMGWDKGDCTDIGLARILLIQEIKKEIVERGQYYDGQYNELLEALYQKYNS